MHLTSRCGFRRTNGIGQWLHHHQHTGAAAIRPVINSPMFVRGKIPRVKTLKLNNALLYSPTSDTVLRNRLKHLRKQ